MNLSAQELINLMDKGHNIYEIWKDPIYVGTKHGKGGDYYTDPVLQVQSFSDTNKLPTGVTKRFSPIKKLKMSGDIHRWSYGAGYAESSDISTLLEVFRISGYPVVRVEKKTNQFGRSYLLYYVVNINK